jgi:glutamine synthetase
MIDIRAVCDGAEETVPAELWTLATYKDLLFLDSHSVTEPDYFGE